MKKPSLALLLLSMFWTATAASAAESKAEKQSITRIRAEFKAVNDLAPKLEKRTFDVMDFSTEGGSATAFLKDGRVRKLEVGLFGELGRRKIDFYYYEDGGLFFVFDRNERYDKHIMEGGGKVVESSETRYYFKDGALIRLIDPKGKKLDVGLEASKKMADEVGALSKKLLELCPKTKAAK